MATNVRVRRPPSPPPQTIYTPPPAQPRFPHPKHEHLDADERRTQASKPYFAGRRTSPGGLNVTSAEWRLLILVVIVACIVRLFRISQPNSVVFDEVHFGKFASKYIKTQFFVDVHPPLAKLLITLAGFLFGYDGNFDFKEISKIYENVPYVAMRMVPAILGVATVPLAYLTMRGLECRATTALLAAVFVTFENGLVTQSRHILLDSPLLFFTSLTTFLWVGFCNEDKRHPFSEGWWTWLMLTGLSLGAVVSCKWVGLFTIATIGFSTVYQLWNLLGDLRVPPRLWIRHFMARALCLIVVPILFYFFIFEIHFLILENSGEGDGFMSAEFQHTLGGRGMQDTYADVAIGSAVNLRHINTQGGYLHSHAHNYPGGSKQQQVTLYPHRDSNNDWRIIIAKDSGHPETEWADEPLQHVTGGMKVRLRHVITDKNLHSHDFRPPVSDVDFQNEVSTYGMTNFIGDANDDWFVEIEHGDKSDKESSKRLRTLRTVFRLKHAMTGCYLFSHKVKLPDWGFEQQEVTCNKNAMKANSLWMIETATHPNLPPDAQKVNYRLPGFFAKFWELQKVMWITNAGLTDRHVYDSRPDQWPRLRRGINFWVKDRKQIYLLGNPFVWWSSTLAATAYMFIRGLLILRAKRGYRDFDNTKVVKYDSLCGFLFMGWFLHYSPFFLMTRQLFLHHYFPALYFAILLFCSFFDLMTAALRPKIRLQIGAVLMIIAIWNFWYLSPLAYGNQWTSHKCRRAQWLRTWDFSCNEFPADYAGYSSQGPAATKVGAASIVGGDGRAAIVVDDAPPAGGKPPGSESSVLLAGHPEPGRDVFAAEPIDPMKSQTVRNDEAKQPPEEKVVSTVAAAAVRVVNIDDLTKANKPSDGSDTPISPTNGSTSTGNSDKSDQEPEDKSTSDNTSTSSEEEQASTKESEPPKEQGPVEEEVAEADRVRAELFNDNPDQGVEAT